MIRLFKEKPQMMTGKLTPAMQQYVDLKQEHPDSVLLFRLGDFYEVFFEDAVIVSKALDLVLTSKNKNAENPIPMAGLPYHAVEKYIPKLIALGHKVAIAEQMSNPVPGQIVKREIVQVITPGTYIADNNMTYNFICAIAESDGKYHIAWGDFSVGHYYTKTFSDPSEMQKFLVTLSVSEYIFSSGLPIRDVLQTSLSKYDNVLFSTHDVPRKPASFIEQVCKIQTIASFGQALEGGRERAFALLAYYVHFTQKSPLHNISHIRLHNEDTTLLLDDVTIKNLELFHASYEHDARYSLFGVLNNTKTSAGARLFQSMLQYPLKDKQAIEQRFAFVERYKELQATSEIHQTLGYMSDIQKTVSAIIYRKTLPALFVRLRSTLALLTQNDKINQETAHLGLSGETQQEVEGILTYLTQVFKDDDMISNEKDFIRDGYDQTVDDLRKMAYNADEVLLQFQREVQESFGVTSRLKYVKNQGYFLEVSQKDVADFEANIIEDHDQLGFVRRHTLKAAQRYTSPYLDRVQQEILSARDKLLIREQELLNEAKGYLLDHQDALAHYADIVAQLDVYTSHALLTDEKKLVRPLLKDESGVHIEGGRHLVIEEFLPKDQHFIPNDLEVGGADGLVHIVTGPNMGGKSTFLRQNALIVLMAHCGFYVPATKAEIGIVDGIFARVGSGDIIAKNQSTFMTEMIEVANILHNASAKSFVVFDELGRGTSTYDGMALTKTILEYIINHLGCQTLLATHYHELVELADHHETIKNFSVSVYETDKEVVFLKKIVAGGANKSYGIDVAQLAGLPTAIIDQARIYLNEMEAPSGDSKAASYASQPLFQVAATPVPSNEYKDRFKALESSIKNLDLNNMTPLEALTALNELKKGLDI